MKRATILLLFVLIAGMCSAGDMKYTMEVKAGAGAPPMTTTIYVKGDQQRSDMSMMGMGTISTITHCGQKQSMTIGERCKAYFTQAIDENGSPVPVAADNEPSRKGGVVKIDNTIRDTGERQKIMGYEARHLIMKMVMDAAPGSCNPGHSEIENDMWVIDVALPGCVAKSIEGPPRTARTERGGCEDKVEISTTGNAKMGLPVRAKMTMMAQGQPMTMTTEIKDISTAPLDDALFQPPAGYKQAKSAQDVMMCGMGGPGGVPSIGGAIAEARKAEAEARKAQADAAATAQPTGIRIGVVVTDRSGKLDAAKLSGDMVEQINQHSGFDAVRIEATSPADIQKEAAEKKCTFILYSDVQDASTGMPKIGGMLGRVAGRGGNVQPTQTIKTDYRLTAVQPPDRQIARESINHSEQTTTMGQATPALVQKVADRAVQDASKAKK